MKTYLLENDTIKRAKRAEIKNQSHGPVVLWMDDDSSWEMDGSFWRWTSADGGREVYYPKSKFSEFQAAVKAKRWA